MGDGEKRQRAAPLGRQRGARGTARLIPRADDSQVPKAFLSGKRRMDFRFASCARLWLVRAYLCFWESRSHKLPGCTFAGGRCYLAREGATEVPFALLPPPPFFFLLPARLQYFSIYLLKIKGSFSIWLPSLMNMN